MANDDNVSTMPMKPYACRINFQSTKRSFFAFRGGRKSTSASGFSYAKAVAAAQSVQQQIIIIRNDDRICGNPKRTLVITGQNSAKEPAGRRNAIVFFRLS